MFSLSSERERYYIFFRQEKAMTLSHQIARNPEAGAVLTKAAVRAADRLGLSGRQLADIVGVSEATVSRWKRGESLLEPGSKPFELAALLVRTFRSLDAITGGDEAVARRWLGAPNTALAARPVERMTQVQGLVDVTTYLDARRAPL
jgi:transcriptional regulator with XRE-family HTH domain